MPMYFDSIKSIIASRTIWAILALTIIGLLGVNLQEIPNVVNQKIARAVLSISLISCAVMGIWFRVSAKHQLHKTSYDSGLFSLMCVPIGLAMILSSTGCSTQNRELTALDHAKIAVSTMNDAYLPAREAYEKLYDMASAETKELLNKKVNPFVNRANESLLKLTTIIVHWANTEQMPEDYDRAKAEAEKDLADALKAMTQAEENPE